MSACNRALILAEDVREQPRVNLRLDAGGVK
jgi:hypothetical protein